MIRKIIKIDEDLCNGCGACASACQEGAIGMVDGKAKLLRDDYCDGLGNCLPVCPTNAISFEEREALEFDEAAVKENERKQKAKEKTMPMGCPGQMAKQITRKPVQEDQQPSVKAESELRQWPVQIKLVPTKAAYFDGAKLLVAADCTAFAYANFHQDFIKNHITIIGCPKLDMCEYAEKLTEIIKQNAIKSIKVVRMEVPCCGGIEYAVQQAIMHSGKMLPWQTITVGVDGNIVDES